MTETRTHSPIEGLQSDKSAEEVPIVERGTLLGREITNEDERRFLLKQLAAARRKRK